MKRYLLFLLLLCTVSASYAYKKDSIFVTVNGVQRNIITYTPNTLKKNVPLLIITHGMGQDPHYQYTNDKWYTMIDTAQFVCAYLRSNGSSWSIWDNADLDFVSKTIPEMNTRYGIDESRVYWTGFSMGSMLIYHGIPSMREKIAAFAPCSGVVSAEPWKNTTGPVNLIHCHSNGDTVFPIDEYKPRDYAAHFATEVDVCKNYTKQENFMPKGGWDTCTKEHWTNGKDGSEVEILMCNGGGHWPTRNYIQEIWAFVKRFSLLSDLERYQRTLAQAIEMCETWENDYDVINKTEYKTLHALTTNLGPDKIDTTSVTKLQNANTRLTTAMTNLETRIKSVVKTSHLVTLDSLNPNFHVYLAFGQSNMEGNATPELSDYAGISERFLTMAAVNMSTYKRTKGKWYMARPPMCRDYTGLTPCDYFGKAMAASLPDSISVGVINVALGGCAIEMFNEDGLSEHIASCADFLKGYASEYNNNPFRELVNLAKKAQQVGVIKGILLHQGCSNNSQSDWPEKVKVIYNRLLDELDLKAEDCPLLVGELLSKAQGGVCSGHNSVIAKVPSVIPTAHVISSKDCPGASDGLHFTAEGYRMIGKRYAEAMLPIIQRQVVDHSPELTQLKMKSTEFTLSPASTTSLTITGVDADGNQRDVTASCVFSSSNPDLLSFGKLDMTTASAEGDAVVTVTYTSNAGTTVTTEFTVKVRIFPLTVGSFNPSIVETGTFSVGLNYGKFQSKKGGQGGWSYGNGLDLSNYRYLVLDMYRSSSAKASLRIYDANDITSSSYANYEIMSEKQVVVDLQDMKDANGNRIDPSHVYYVTLCPLNNYTMLIGNVSLTNEDPTTGISSVSGEEKVQPMQIFDLSGRPVNAMRRGVYIVNGKKVLK